MPFICYYNSKTFIFVDILKISTTKKTMFDLRLSLLLWDLSDPTRMFSETTLLQITQNPTCSTPSIARLQSYLSGGSKTLILGFWKFYQSRLSTQFTLCRENHFWKLGNQLPTNSVSSLFLEISDLKIYIYIYSSNDLFIKRVKRVNHCWWERISIHSFSNPHFFKVPAFVFWLPFVGHPISLLPFFHLSKTLEMEASINCECQNLVYFQWYNQPAHRV